MFESTNVESLKQIASNKAAAALFAVPTNLRLCDLVAYSSRAHKHLCVQRQHNETDAIRVQLIAQRMLGYARRYGGKPQQYEEIATLKTDLPAEDLINKITDGWVGIPVDMAEDEYLPDWCPSLDDMTRINGRYFYSDAMQYCECCEEHYPKDADLTEVITRLRPSRQREDWCENCTDNHAFYCDVSNDHYSNAVFSRSVARDGNTLCTDIADGHGYSYSESLDQWVADEDWDDAHDNSNSGGYILPQYHEAHRNWNSTKFPRFDTPLDRTYGIELEVDFGDSETRYDFFTNHFDTDGSNARTKFSAELDGSLDDDSGLEIIGPPIPLREYYDPDGRWHRMCRALQDAGAVGWAVRQQYGMHVNVDWRFEGEPAGWPDSVQMQKIQESMDRFEAFMLNNRPLCSMIAGRTFVYGTSDSNANNLNHDGGGYRKVRSIHEMNENANGTKYNLVRQRDDDLPLMEVRIFGSNIRVEGIIRNIEFVDSLRIYTMDPNANIFAGAGSASYRQWLAQPMNAARWSYVASYLRPSKEASSNPLVVSFAKAQRLAVA